MRTQIHKKLEEDIGEFLRKLDELKSESKTKAHETIRGLKEKLNVIQDLKASVALLKENGTELQVYLSLKHLETNLSKEENNLTTNIENGQYDSVEFVFNLANDTPSLSLVGKVGEIEFKQKPLKVNSGDMGQSVKLSRKIKEKEPFTTDEVLQKYRPSLAVVARLCLICVYLLDCIIVGLKWSDDRQYIWLYHSGIFHQADLLLSMVIFGQIAGCLIVILRRKIKIGCLILSLVKVSQIYLLSKDDETPFFRAILYVELY